MPLGLRPLKRAGFRRAVCLFRPETKENTEKLVRGRELIQWSILFYWGWREYDVCFVVMIFNV